MDQNEQKIFTPINRLSLHVLAYTNSVACTSSWAAEKGLLEYDRMVRNGPVISNCTISKSGESYTTRTIRTVCKAF